MSRGHPGQDLWIAHESKPEFPKLGQMSRHPLDVLSVPASCLREPRLLQTFTNYGLVLPTLQSENVGSTPPRLPARARSLDHRRLQATVQLSGVHNGNFSSVQLLSLTGLLFRGGAIGRMSSFLRDAGLGVLFLAALAALTLFKPNIALVGALLTAHLGVRHGPRLFAAAAIPAAGGAAPSYV